MPFIISSNRVLLAHGVSMSRPEHVAAILVIEARLNKMDACIEARLEKMDARIVILQKSIDDLAVGLHDLGDDVDAM